MTKKTPDNLPVKQHYVPAWLLRFFVQRYEQTGNLCVHDLKEERTFSAPPKKVGFEEHFYTLDQEDKESSERFIVETGPNQTIDRTGPRIVNAIRKSERLPVGPDLNWLLGVIAWQAWRTPAARDGITAETEGQYRDFLQLMRTDPEVFASAKKDMLARGGYEDLEDFTHEEFVEATPMDAFRLDIPKNYVVETFMRQAARLNDALLQRHWKLLVTKGNDRFIVNDNPVQTINLRPGSNAIASPDALVVMPITQRLAVAGYPQRTLGWGDVEHVPRSCVATINTLMVAYAKRWLYSTEPSFYWLHEGRVVTDEGLFAHRKKMVAAAEATGRRLHVRLVPGRRFQLETDT